MFIKTILKLILHFTKLIIDTLLNTPRYKNVSCSFFYGHAVGSVDLAGKKEYLLRIAQILGDLNCAFDKRSTYGASIERNRPLFTGVAMSDEQAIKATQCLNEQTMCRSSMCVFSSAQQGWCVNPTRLVGCDQERGISNCLSNNERHLTQYHHIITATADPDWNLRLECFANGSDALCTHVHTDNF